MANDRKTHILDSFQVFYADIGGIVGWLGPKAPNELWERLARIDSDHLTRAQLVQLLLLSHEGALSNGFFRYYWLTAPSHPYAVEEMAGFQHEWINAPADIKSLEHLRWGLYRLYVDALLYFGNIRSAYRELRSKSFEELQKFFAERMFNPNSMVERGIPLDLNAIPKEDRYLISEMACKSLDPTSPGEGSKFKAVAKSSLRRRGQGGPATINQLLLDLPEEHKTSAQELQFTATEIGNETVTEEADIDRHAGLLERRYQSAHKSALNNTSLYLSSVNDLDVYVATSMRSREDFLKMADFCTKVFGAAVLRSLNLRYFDPTLSAAEGHEDKGLIECLMVKCAKVLIYYAGDKDSYGKDVEAAMALSLGKPVIFYCSDKLKERFFKEVHQLSRLIHFDSGVAVGAIVSDDEEEISALLQRIFHNKMVYELIQPKPGYFKLKEQLTGSIVRLQTNDALLRETFWNHYRNRPD